MKYYLYSPFEIEGSRQAVGVTQRKKSSYESPPMLQ